MIRVGLDARCRVSLDYTWTWRASIALLTKVVYKIPLLAHLWSKYILPIYTTVQCLVIALGSRPPNIARYRDQLSGARAEMRVDAAGSNLLPGALREGRSTARNLTPNASPICNLSGAITLHSYVIRSSSNLSLFQPFYFRKGSVSEFQFFRQMWGDLASKTCWKVFFWLRKLWTGLKF